MPSTDNDQTDHLVARINDARARGTALAVTGSNSKAFLGNPVNGEALTTAEHTGILNYAPSELVMTVRAGTRLASIEQALRQNGQMLGFEPPHFGGAATIGGTVACGLSGPRRPFSGSARDFVLGARMVNGRGEIMRFGGEVMKNVAGYDVSRLLTASYGTLGLLLDVSLKVLPVPAAETTRVLSATAEEANRRCVQAIQQGHPLSATLYDGEQLCLRLSGNERHVMQAAADIGGEELAQADAFWTALREHRHPFFQDMDAALWRLSMPVHSLPPALDGAWLSEWAGAQHWLKSDLPVDEVRAGVNAAGGHATLYRGHAGDPRRFHPLPDNLLQLHRQLKQAFDPDQLFNPDRLYPGL